MARLAMQIGSLGLRSEYDSRPDACGVVVCVGGLGRGADAARQRYLTHVLHEHLLDTLILEPGAGDGFDVALVVRWLAEAMDGLLARPPRHRLGLFGASAGAAVVLQVAADHPGRVAAIVSHGGRPGLAGAALAQVQAPTLLLCGGADIEALENHRAAMRLLRCNKRLEIVPGALQGFEAPGELESAAQLAGAWFAAHLASDGLH